KQLKSLPIEVRSHERKAGHIPFGLGKTGCQAGRDRITAKHVVHRNRQTERADHRYRRALRYDQIDRYLGQLSRQSWHLVNCIVAIAENDKEVTAFYEAQFRQTSAKSIHVWRQAGGLLCR